MSTSRRVAMSQALALLVFIACPPLGQPAKADDRPKPSAPPSVVVDPVNLTEVSERILTGLDICAVVHDTEFAQGLQKAADVWGLHVDLFVTDDAKRRDFLLLQLVKRRPAALITDSFPDEPQKELVEAITEANRVRRGGLGPLPIVTPIKSAHATKVLSEIWEKAQPKDRPKSKYEQGFLALKATRADLLPQIPKFDEIFPIAFPISPMPDSFFQASKFPYPDPVIRSVRTVSSKSASAHAHTSCHSNALLGNMIHRTSKPNPDIFLLGFEGGNLSIKAMPEAVTKDKLSAVMTSYVIAVRGNSGEKIDLLSENDKIATSHFKPSIHCPEELEAALAEWKTKGVITGFKREGDDELLLEGFKGGSRRFRAAFFIVSSDRTPTKPFLETGVDGHGRWIFEMTSTQRFVQLFTEVAPAANFKKRASSPDDLTTGLKLAMEQDLKELKGHDIPQIGQKVIPLRSAPRGGLLNEAGTMVGATVGVPLGSILIKVAEKEPKFQPYIMTFEGGFLVVTPEKQLTDELLKGIVSRIDFDERGPLGSDQTLSVELTSGKVVTFRRTILNFSYLDKALEDVKRQAWVSGWEFVGARGQGLAANVVLHNFLGKHRKFMSSLNTWPSNDRPNRPYIRWYVDGMQRLNFSLVTPEGWRQEFVEVPIRVPPIPRDIELFSGQHKLD